MNLSEGGGVFLQIRISDHFTYSKLLRFSLPSIIMMIFTSMYTIVDGIFVSNLAGADAFASLNLIWPAIGLLGAFGFMIGAGGTALVSKTLGEGNQKLACEYFSMLVVFEILIGILVSIVTIAEIVPISYLLGATDDLIADCVLYGVPLLAAQCLFYLHATFQPFLIAAEKAKLGLAVTILSGITNMVLDYFLIAVVHMGIMGAALATAAGWAISSLIPAWWFWKHQEAPIHFTRFRWHFRALGQSCLNGSSEMVTNLSASLVLMLYNLELMQLVGPDGVVAYGVIQYILFLFSAAFFGYTMAVAPCIGFQFGAGDRKELKNLFGKSMLIILIASIVLTITAEILASLLSMVFVSYSESLMTMTTHAIRIFSICFLMSGFNIFASGFFTALNNGPVSALLSFGRAFVFQIGSILLLPVFFGVEGIWASSVVAEFLSLLLGIWCLLHYRKRYGY